jgi:hypothetical protein
MPCFGVSIKAMKSMSFRRPRGVSQTRHWRNADARQGVWPRYKLSVAAATLNMHADVVLHYEDANHGQK